MLRKKLICMFMVAFMVMAITPYQGLASESQGQNAFIDSASSWAIDSIMDALLKDFVPLEIQGDYQRIITRAEFCRMAVMYIECATRKNIEYVMVNKGVTHNWNAFTDTRDPYIVAAYALGVTSGTGNNQFSPNGQISREQAATMLRNVCKVFGADVNNSPASGFADSWRASSWAVDSIDFCKAYGIMSGTGNNSFDPKSPYTREQSIVTFNNIVPESLPGSKMTVYTPAYSESSNLTPSEPEPAPAPTPAPDPVQIPPPEGLVNFTNLEASWNTLWALEDRFELKMNYQDSPRVYSSGVKCWDENGDEVAFIGINKNSGVAFGCNGVDFAAEYVKEWDSRFYINTIDTYGSHRGSLVPGETYYWIGYVILVENRWYYETPVQSFVYSTTGSRFG